MANIKTEPLKQRNMITLLCNSNEFLQTAQHENLHE